MPLINTVSFIRVSLVQLARATIRWNSCRNPGEEFTRVATHICYNVTLSGVGPQLLPHHLSFIKCTIASEIRMNCCGGKRAAINRENNELQMVYMNRLVTQHQKDLLVNLFLTHAKILAIAFNNKWLNCIWNIFDLTGHLCVYITYLV